MKKIIFYTGENKNGSQIFGNTEATVKINCIEDINKIQEEIRITKEYKMIVITSIFNCD